MRSILCRVALSFHSNDQTLCVTLRPCHIPDLCGCVYLCGYVYMKWVMFVYVCLCVYVILCVFRESNSYPRHTRIFI